MSNNLSIELQKEISKQFKAVDYILHEGLKNAVEVALALGQPLLLTGEPGTGKTRLADKIAHDLAQDTAHPFSPEPLVFNTKTTSVARDLFYSYDALSHFQMANIKKSEKTDPATTASFIELQALGKAIAQTNPTGVDTSRFNTRLEPGPMSAVVLIDEIDKAPRDFTNDTLHEIDRYEFQIKEQDNYPIRKSEEHRIMVVMTSNSEKNLPDAFLRRCVFYHIPFPSRSLLMDIVQLQLGTSTPFTEEALHGLLDQFDKIRRHSVRKPPATAELLGWLRILELHRYMERDEQQKQQLMLHNLSILVKTGEDLAEVKKLFSL